MGDKGKMSAKEILSNLDKAQVNAEGCVVLEMGGDQQIAKKLVKRFANIIKVGGKEIAYRSLKQIYVHDRDAADNVFELTTGITWDFSVPWVEEGLVQEMRMGCGTLEVSGGVPERYTQGSAKGVARYKNDDDATRDESMAQFRMCVNDIGDIAFLLALTHAHALLAQVQSVKIKSSLKDAVDVPLAAVLQKGSGEVFEWFNDYVQKHNQGNDIEAQVKIVKEVYDGYCEEFDGYVKGC